MKKLFRKLTILTLAWCMIASIFTLADPDAFGQTVLSDPVGDASGHDDATGISGGYNASDLLLSASFQPGTLDRANLGFIFGLDTDQNPSTGVGPPSFFPLGAEFTVFFNSGFSLSEARLFDIGSMQLIGTLPISFGTDTLGLTVPLSLLHNDDGAMNFGFIVGIPTGSDSFEAFDVVPDGANGGPLAGPTTFVPEPSTYTLLGGGLLLIGLWWRYRGHHADRLIKSIA